MGRNFIFPFPALIFGAFFAGASTLFVRLSDLGPIGSAFYRALLAVPILWIWVLVEFKRSNKPIKIPLRKDFLIILWAGLFFAGDLFFWHLSIVKTSVANATLFATLSPIFVAIGMYFGFREKPKAGFVIGVILAFIGSSFLIGDGISFKREQFFGNIYGIITGMFFACYLIAVSRVRGNVSTASVMLYSTIVTALVLWPAALYLEESIFPGDLLGWYILIALALFSHVGGQGLIAFALAYLPAAFSSVTLILEVVSASLLGWVFLEEEIVLMQWIGGGIIFCGILIAGRKS